MSSQAWQKSSKCLQSSRWKAVLVLSSLKTDNIFFDCFIASASSGFFERQVSLASQTLFAFAAVLIAYQI